MTAQARRLPVSLSATRPAGLSPKQVYDVVVIGSQLGGIVAGALLAKRGYRVLHVDHDGIFDRYADGGWLLPYAPALLPPLKGLPAGQSVLEELGLASDLSRAVEPYPDGLQVLLPRARLSLGREAVARDRELVREFGDEGPALGAQVARCAALEEDAVPLVTDPPALPPDGFFERWSLARAARRSRRLFEGEPPLPPDHPLGAALRALHPFTTYLDEPPTPFAFGRTVSPLLDAPHRYPGGREGLAVAIRANLQAHGGDLLGERGQPVLVEELVLDGGSFAGVKLVGAPAPHRARVCICGTDAAALRRLVPPSRRQRKLSDLADAVRARRFQFTLNLVLSERAIPPGLGELAVAVGLGSRGEESPAVLIQVSPAITDKGAIDPGRRTVTAAAFVESSVRDLGEEGFRQVAAQLRDVLEEVLPFHDRHLTLASAPYLAAVGSRGSRLLPHPLLEISLPRSLGVEGLPASAPIKRLLFAGREVLPGLGLEGEFLAAQRAADLAAEVCKKVDPLL